MNKQGNVEDIATGQISEIVIHDANGKCGKDKVLRIARRLRDESGAMRKAFPRLP